MRGFFPRNTVLNSTWLKFLEPLVWVHDLMRSSNNTYLNNPHWSFVQLNKYATNVDKI